MKDISAFLEGFEKLAYQLLTWFIMIPKTLAKIISDPGWVPGYVRKELDDKETARFDDYFSPIILFLLVTLVPVAILNTFALPGVSIEGPLQGNVGKTYTFTANADFIRVNNETVTFEWYSVEKNEQGGEDMERQLPPNTYPAYGDEASDTIDVTWSSPEADEIIVVAKNNVGEVYTYTHPITIFEEDARTDSTPQDLEGRTKSGTNIGDLAGTLKGEGSLLAGLFLLSFPLAFTLLTGGMRQGGISGAALKQAFYMQCYYFSPLFLVLFLFVIVSIYFAVPSFILHTVMLLLAFVIVLGMLVWFVGAETQFVIQERKVRSPFNALLRVIGIIVLIVLAVILVVMVIADEDILRDAFWGIYLFFVLATFIFGGWRWLKNRKRRGGQQAPDHPAPDGPLPLPERDQPPAGS